MRNTTRMVATAGLACMAIGCATLSDRQNSSDRKKELEASIPIAQAALEAGQIETAERMYRALEERHPKEPDPLLGLGYTALASGRYEEAVKRYARAARLAGRRGAVFVRASLGQGRALLARGRTTESIRVLERVRQRGVEEPQTGTWIENTLGVAWVQIGRSDLARVHFRKAIELDAGNEEARGNLDRSGGGTGTKLMLLLRMKDFARGHEEPGRRPRETGNRLMLRLEQWPMWERRKEMIPRSVNDDITLSPGQTRRMALPGEVSSVSVGAPEVADIQVLDKSVVYVVGKNPGRTSVSILTSQGDVSEYVVEVRIDLRGLREALGKDERLKDLRAYHMSSGSARIDGEVNSIEDAERALRIAVANLGTEAVIENAIEMSGAQQVNLEVQIAEVSRAVTEALGVNWEAFRARGRDGIGFQIGRSLANPGPVTNPIVIRPGVIDGGNAPGFVATRHTGNTRIAAMIDALATAGLANVLARPNMTAASGESASFFSGGEFPLPTGFDDGVITFDYKKYGVLLDFVPTIIDEERISISVRPEVSEPSRGQGIQVVSGVVVPVINVRRAETTVEVRNGDSIIIAGLFRNRASSFESGVPGVKDVPLLGPLFSYRVSESEELELIVVVTATVVEHGEIAANAGQGTRAGMIEVNGYRF